MPDGPSTIDLLTPAADVTLSGGFSLLGVLVSLWLLFMGQLVLWAQRAAARFGFASPSGFARYGRLFRYGGVLGLLFVGARGLAHGLETAWALALLAMALALLALTGTLQDALAGLHLQYRLRLREGERIAVGALEGTLSSLHWDHVVVRSPDGGLRYVPNRVLARGEVEVQAMRGATPLSLRLPGDLCEDLGPLRDTVALLPYRVAATPVHVRRQGDVIEVRCYLWSEQARAAAEARVRALATETPQDP